MAAMASTTGTALGKRKDHDGRGSQRGGISFQIYRILLHQQSSNRLKCDTEIDVLTIAQTALYSSAMITLCCNTGSNILIHGSIFWHLSSISLRDKYIILLTSAGSNSGKSLAIFKPFTALMPSMAAPSWA